MKSACVLYFLALFISVESDLTPEENIRKVVETNGYSFESHQVETQDKYLLTLHRIPHGKRNVTCEKTKPILLMHGLLSSSENWIVRSLEKGLAFRLANKCYDVWMGNQRGNGYSRKHSTLDPDKNASKFFDFSFNEIGYYDLPAMIDFILSKTKEKRIFYMGHSQGTTVFWVMMSERPEYNSKIHLMEALSPIAYLEHLSHVYCKAAAFFWKEIKKFLDSFNKYELRIKDFKRYHEMFKNFCKVSSLFKMMCQKISKLIPLEIVDNTSAGISSKQIYHFSQEILSHKFQKYDYGEKENLVRYGQKEPPSYNLTRTTTPVSISYAIDDKFSDKRDVFKLTKKLPNIKNIFQVPSKTFRHIDFLYKPKEEAAVTALYNHIIVELNEKR